MKINYDKIKWDAPTNWEFCGTYENLREIHRRFLEYANTKAFHIPIEEFAYETPSRALAFNTGDVVFYTDVHGSGVDAKTVKQYAVVSRPCNKYGTLHVRIADGTEFKIFSNEIPAKVSIADIPDELMALARAEAGKPLDLSKCPLKKLACTGD